MKKLFMLFAVIGLFGATSINAQTCCSKTASASCTKAAATAATMDADIEKRMSEETGAVYYVRKVVNADTGTSYVNVDYNADAKKFVNVSPTHTSGKTASTSSSKEGTTTPTSGKTAACCSKDKAAACTKKSASTTAVKKSSTVKVVKTSSTN
ncbi:MAG: hypothetical protein ACI8VT_003824 [Saprospiraceae bacterium]|jgi:hypothetical protein